MKRRIFIVSLGGLNFAIWILDSPSHIVEFMLTYSYMTMGYVQDTDDVKQ